MEKKRKWDRPELIRSFSWFPSSGTPWFYPGQYSGIPYMFFLAGTINKTMPFCVHFLKIFIQNRHSKNFLEELKRHKNKRPKKALKTGRRCICIMSHVELRWWLTKKKYFLSQKNQKCWPNYYDKRGKRYQQSKWTIIFITVMLTKFHYYQNAFLKNGITNRSIYITIQQKFFFSKFSKFFILFSYTL